MHADLVLHPSFSLARAFYKKLNATQTTIIIEGRTLKRIISMILALLIGASTLASAHGQNTQQYHSDIFSKTETRDMTFRWSASLPGGGNWHKFKLWDDGLTTHFYLYFYYSVEASMDIPATLRFTYPNIIEPGEYSTMNVELQTQGSRVIKIRPLIYLGIDLDLPIPIYIPNVGVTEDIKAVYGGDWTINFDLSSRALDQLLNKVWIGDFNTQQLFSRSMTLNKYMTIERLNINSNTLGELVTAKIRIDLLKAFLEILTLIVSGGTSAFVRALVQILDWMLSKVFRISTGLIITPSILANAQIPVSGEPPNIVLQNQNLLFASDLSSKTIPLSVSSNAEEGTMHNSLGIGIGPATFTYSFDVNWQYYFDIDVKALGYSIYQETWMFNLFRYPAIQWDSEQVMQSIELESRVDEPLSATAPSVSDGKVAIELNDDSGISDPTMYYSEDQSNWNALTLQNSMGKYATTTITEVTKDTNIYYYFEIKDGDGDSYKIGSRSNPYSYLLRPASSSLVLPFSPGSPLALNIITIAVVAILATTGIVLVVRSKHQSKKR